MVDKTALRLPIWCLTCLFLDLLSKITRSAIQGERQLFLFYIPIVIVTGCRVFWIGKTLQDKNLRTWTFYSNINKDCQLFSASSSQVQYKKRKKKSELAERDLSTGNYSMSIFFLYYIELLLLSRFINYFTYLLYFLRWLYYIKIYIRDYWTSIYLSSCVLNKYLSL